MKLAEAKSFVAVLSALFPKDPMPDSTVQVWSMSLTQIDVRDAQVAVEDCGHIYDRMPSLHQVLGACERARIDRLMTIPTIEESGFASVGFKEWLKTQPADTQKRARKAFTYLRDEFTEAS